MLDSVRVLSLPIVLNSDILAVTFGIFQRRVIVSMIVPNEIG